MILKHILKVLKDFLYAYNMKIHLTISKAKKKKSLQIFIYESWILGHESWGYTILNGY